MEAVASLTIPSAGGRPLRHADLRMTKTWACGRCGVRSSFAAGALEPAEPIGWARTGWEWRCLACRRAEVIEAAASNADADAARRRRRALTEFELLRDPSASDQRIAKRVNCATRTVAPVRAALRAAGQLAPSR